MAMDRRQLLKGAGAGAGVLAVGLPKAAHAAVPVNPVAVGSTGLTGVLQLARVWPGAEGLLDDFDDTHNVFEDGSIEVLLWPGDLERLAATGLRYRITVGDLVARDRALDAAAAPRSAALAAQPGERTAYRRLADYEKDLRDLAGGEPRRRPAGRAAEQEPRGSDRARHRDRRGGRRGQTAGRPSTWTASTTRASGRRRSSRSCGHSTCSSRTSAATRRS
jgi:hypothetical protein